MSRTLRWVLGILAVLVILAVAAGAVWAWQNRSQILALSRPYATQQNPQVRPTIPNVPNGPRGFGNNGRNPLNGFGFRGPMRGSRGRFLNFGPFGLGIFFLGGLLRLFIPLAILVVVALIFYQLGKRAATPRHEPVPAPPAEPNPPQTP